MSEKVLLSGKLHQTDVIIMAVFSYTHKVHEVLRLILLNNNDKMIHIICAMDRS